MSTRQGRKYMNEVIVLSEYHKKSLYGFPNPKHNGNSALLIEMKEKNIAAIEYYSYLLNEWLPENVSICVLPSYETNIHYSGLNEVIDLVSQLKRRKNISQCLEYQTFRTMIGEYATELIVKEPEIIEGKNILLINDLMVTGRTLQNGIDILKKSGVNQIFPRVIGKQYVGINKYKVY